MRSEIHILDTVCLYVSNIIISTIKLDLKFRSLIARDLLSALKCLGLNTMEQEIMDMINSAGSKAELSTTIVQVASIHGKDLLQAPI